MEKRVVPLAGVNIQRLANVVDVKCPYARIVWMKQYPLGNQKNQNTFISMNIVDWQKEGMKKIGLIEEGMLC